ncbi:unnamed protein product [Rhizopus stolonifer]
MNTEFAQRLVASMKDRCQAQGGHDINYSNNSKDQKTWLINKKYCDMIHATNRTLSVTRVTWPITGPDSKC